MQVTEISSTEYAAGIINSISGGYKSLRQQSKAPTFCTDVCRYLVDTGKQLWFHG